MTAAERCPCGATLSGSTPGRAITCRHCGRSSTLSGITPATHARPLPIHASRRWHICEACPYRSGSRCGLITATGKPGQLWHARGLHRLEASCPDARWPAGIPPTVPPQASDAVAIITTHWNPLRFARLAATWHEWQPTIGLPVQTRELVLQDDPAAPQAPEIPGATVIRGGPRNWAWQKEALTNRALAELPASVRYVAWIDHDAVFERPDWLAEACRLIDRGHPAVQPFADLLYLDRRGAVTDRSHGAAYALAQGQPPTSAPGLAWVADRHWLDSIGGLYPYHAVGGGDATFWHAITGTRDGYLDRLPPAMRAHVLAYLERVSPVDVAHVPGTVRHLWHGDRSQRQYTTRDRILRRHDIDPARDLSIDAAGLLRWADHVSPGLIADIRDYFADRRDDG